MYIYIYIYICMYIYNRPCAYVRHDSMTYMPWCALDDICAMSCIRLCDMTRSYLWHGAPPLMYVAWLVFVCETWRVTCILACKHLHDVLPEYINVTRHTHPHVCNMSCICVCDMACYMYSCMYAFVWLLICIHTRDIRTWRVSSICVMDHIFECVTCLVFYVWHALLVCVTCLIRMCDMPDVCVWHAWCVWVTCFICMCHMSYLNVWHESR